MTTKLDADQVIKHSYDETASALRVRPTPASLVDFNVDFDYIEVTYPAATQEVYTYKAGGASGTTVGTVTINYTNSSKDVLLNVAKVVV